MNLLQYIFEFSIRCNHGENYQVIEVSDLLIIASTFQIFEVIKIDPYEKTLQFFPSIDASVYRDNIIEYNFLDALESNNFSNLSGEGKNLAYGKLKFTLAHFLCYLGHLSDLQKVVKNPNVCITADALGKSPFYYAYVKRRHDCVDLLLQQLDVIRGKNLKNYEASIFALRNDISLLIANSSTQLHLLLNNLLKSSKPLYANVTENLPVLKIGFTPSVEIHDFPVGSEEIPVLLQCSRVPLIGRKGCMHNLILLDAIIKCSNYQALRSPIIEHFVTLQYKETIELVILFTLLLFANIILLLLLIGLNNFELYLFIPFLIVNSFLFIWELLQIFTNYKRYFKDVRNYIDVARALISFLWVILEKGGFSDEHFRWVVAFINLARGISVFRLFDGTRFYIELIARSFSDIKYFFLMFVYSTFGFGFLLTISKENPLNFENIWIASYDMNFGDKYQDINYITEVNYMEYSVFFGATVINLILMLNLLISILGESYEKFQVEQSVIQIKVKSKIALDLQTMLRRTHENSMLKYITLCTLAFDVEEERDWKGRIKHIDEKLDKNFNEMMERNQVIERRILETNTSVNNMIKENNQILEDKIRQNNRNLEAKIKESSDLAMLQITHINQKLEIIIEMISK